MQVVRWEDIHLNSSKSQVPVVRGLRVDVR